MALRILLVDDEAVVLRILNELLQDQGYEVAMATSVTEAKKAVMTADKGFDAAFVDIRMPGGSGLELLPWFADAGKDFPVFLISAYTDVDQARAKSLGARAFIEKPLDLNSILAWLADLNGT